MAVNKRIKLNPNVLLDWIYDDNNVRDDNYSIVTNINEQSRSYVSALPLNNINNNLFTIDKVLKRYCKIEIEKFNFLQKQDYSGNYIAHDKIKIYFPIDYDFSVYIGFNLKFYTLDYTNKKVFTIGNYFYDKTLDSNIGILQLMTPFYFNEKIWGKYIELDIPSIYNVAKDRVVTSTFNMPIENTINYNLTNGVGLSQTAPIFIDFSFLVTSVPVLTSTYYSLGDIYQASVPQQPEYQSLGVEVVESTQGDYFEIYGIYNGTNELLDDFVNDLEVKGKKIQIEYIITLFEENLQSGYPQTIVVTENFAQKILYRPIIRFSNTTAAIDITMNIVDTVFNETIERFASIGITNNIFKYGKTLTRININDNVIKPKIYKSQPDNIVMQSVTGGGEVMLSKIPYPMLYDKYNVSVSVYNGHTQTTDYTHGLLNIIITPFDTILKFNIYKKVINSDGSTTKTVYNLSEIINFR